MKNLKGCTFLFVFFLILGSCGSGVSVYEPAQESGLDNPEVNDGGGSSDDATTAALLSAIFDGDDGEIVVNAEDCEAGTVAVSLNQFSEARVVNIATSIKALSVIPNHPKYAIYKEKVVKKIGQLFSSNWGDDEAMAKTIKILVSNLSEENYALLLKLSQEASIATFDSTDKLAKNETFSCACDKYEEEKEKKKDINYCDATEIEKFKLALDDETEELVDRCKYAIAALSEINNAGPNCIEYAGLKEHYYNTCEIKCQNEYVPIFNKYISEVQKPGDAYCVKALDAASMASKSGVCMDWIIQNMVSSYEGTCGAIASGICSDYSAEFEALYSKIVCTDLSALQKIIDGAYEAGCNVSKEKEIYHLCNIHIKR